MMNHTTLNDIDMGVLEEAARLIGPQRGYGPIAWCNFCHRRHRRREHDLDLVDRVIDHSRRRGRRSGRPGGTRRVWTHTPPRQPAAKKTKARKS